MSVGPADADESSFKIYYPPSEISGVERNARTLTNESSSHNDTVEIGDKNFTKAAPQSIKRQTTQEERLPRSYTQNFEDMLLGK